MLPLVSIIIPCFNNERFIDQCIQSSLNQSYKNIEVIVIDDGSTDSSLERIKFYKDKIIWKSTKNKGAPIARNIGLKLAKGQYIKFLDADDFLHHNSISVQIKYLKNTNFSKKIIVFGDVERIDENNKYLGKIKFNPPTNIKNNVAKIVTKCPLTTSPLHQKHLLTKINGFNETLPKGQEHDLHYRLALEGAIFEYHSDLIYYYREHTSKYRITDSKTSKFGVDFGYNYFLNHLHMAQKKYNGNVPQELKTALAREFWKVGRGILREGHITLAKKCFDTSKQLSLNNIVGNFYYRFMCRIIGPIHSEQLFLLLKGQRMLLDLK